MKIRNLIIVTTTLLLSLFLLAGCKNKQEEPKQQVNYEYYKNGTFSPGYNTYILKLPSAEWKIEGKEDKKDITFVLKKNRISLKKYEKSEEEYQNKVDEIPTTQSELEELLKEKNIKGYYINTFISHVYHDDQYKFLTTQYVYTDSEGTFYINNLFYNDNYLYELTGVTDDEELSDKIQISLNDFVLTEHKKEIKAFKIKEEEIHGNVYNSKNNDYALILSYDNWDFDVPTDYSSNQTTTIFTDGMTITIQKQAFNNLSNQVVYEIPKTIEILNKQIDMKNLGHYNVMDYKVKTIGNLPDYDEEQNFTTFNYLIKCNENADMKYYAYAEYRTEYSTYQLTGISTIENPEKAIELNQILKSFYPTSKY